METYAIKDVIRDVRIAMDDNTQTSASLVLSGDLDYNEMDELIKQKLIEAIRSQHATADIALVKGIEALDKTVTANADGSGSIVLPEHFLRLVRFKMKGWERAATAPIYENDPRYTYQKNRWSRGNKLNPVVSIANYILEYYSLPTATGHEVESFTYIPEPFIYPSYDDSDGTVVEVGELIDIETLLYNNIIILTASLVYLALGDTDKASAMMQLISK